jgi:hypothetical protein
MLILERFVTVNKFDIVCCVLHIFDIHNLLEVGSAHVFTLTHLLLFSFEFSCHVMATSTLLRLKLLLQSCKGINHQVVIKLQQN